MITTSLNLDESFRAAVLILQYIDEPHNRHDQSQIEPLYD